MKYRGQVVEDIARTSQLGRYRLVSTLGQGGMGTIWLGVAGGLGEFRKLLVIKELRWDLTRNHRFVEMFMDEAKLAARLSHPNVVQTLEAGAEDDRYFIAMEFLDGQPLSEVMQRAALDPLLTLPVRLRILCDALAGLHYAHELCEYDGKPLHIVHRDVSPHNIFVTYDGQVKVVDFGIAKAADAENFTQPGMFKGKFAYASPEQVEGRAVDRRADIFAIGVMLWELITLNRFAKGKPTQESFDARISGREVRLSQLPLDVEPLLAEICDRAIDVDPRRRFATAEHMRHALEQYLFLSGERVDTPALAKIMQTVFSAERATMHRVIDNHLKAADCSESLVRQLRPFPTPVPDPHEQDTTTVADLSELAESTSRSEELPMREQLPASAASMAPSTRVSEEPPVPVERPKRSVLWFAAAVAAAALAAALYAWRPSSDSIASVPLPPAAPSPEHAGAAPSAPVAQPTVAAAPMAAPADSAVPAAAQAPVELSPQPAASPAAVEPPRRERRPGRSRSAGAADEANEESSALGGFAFGLGGGDDEDDDPSPAKKVAPSAKPSDEPQEKISAGSMRVTLDDPSQTQAPSSEFGEDLRERRQEQRRTIDTEDPFDEP
jgi:serine/threonine protein kinase